MRTTIIAIMMLPVMWAGPRLVAQTNTDEVAELKRRVAQLEKQVQDISAFLEPLKGQQATVSTRRKALQVRVEKRFALDRLKYTPEQLVEADKLYQIISQKGGTAEAADSFQTILKKYADTDRAGCAALYIAQRAAGDERVKDLQECIDKFGDCMYGDGVQVGAFARLLLAKEYSSRGDDKKAAALVTEIRTKYADSVDHAGNLLADAQVRLAK